MVVFCYTYYNWFFLSFSPFLFLFSYFALLYLFSVNTNDRFFFFPTRLFRCDGGDMTSEVDQILRAYTSFPT